MKKIKNAIKYILFCIKTFKMQNKYKKRIIMKNLKHDEVCDEIHYKGNLLNASIVPIYNNCKSIVTIISDDGDYNTALILNELSLKYDVDLTIAGTILFIDKYINEWKKILENKHIELVNHSYNHIRMKEGSKISKNRKKLEHELIHSRKYYENILNLKQYTFVCPENQMCQIGYELLKQDGILAVRQGTRGVNDIYPCDGKNPGEMYNLKCYGIKDWNDNCEEQRRNIVKSAINENKWLIEMWHNVVDDDKPLYGYQAIYKKEKIIFFI